MKIKRIKGNQPNCKYCKMELKKEPAVWHLTMACVQSCDRHKPMLERIKAAEVKTEHYTEADNQTWMRL